MYTFLPTLLLIMFFITIETRWKQEKIGKAEKILFYATFLDSLDHLSHCEIMFNTLLWFMDVLVQFYKLRVQHLESKENQALT